QNKNFLSSDNIITFTGNDGRLMALKPDVTLSIVKNTKTDETRKVYYNESVFRTDRNSGEYEEIKQLGLEYIGGDGRESEAEILSLAAASLRVIGAGVIDVSHMGFIEAIMAQFRDQEIYDAVYTALRNKSSHMMKQVLESISADEAMIESMTQLAELSGSFSEVLSKAYTLSKAIPCALQSLDELSNLYEILEDELKSMLRLDFSILNDVAYYNGIIFQGFLKGISKPVISGGRYDNLMTRFKKTNKAIGFALYLDELERVNVVSENSDTPCDDWLNIALPKGRMGDDVITLFEKSGLLTDLSKKEIEGSRRLVFGDKESRIRLLMVKPGDVDSYVQYGTADIGIVGRDTLVENNLDVLELSDLKLGCCRLIVAAKDDYIEDTTRPLRVATKYPSVSRSHYAKKSRQVEIIELKGSVELAPLTGLADVIVDIVETGTTLKENNLVAVEEIMSSSARLIANRAAYRFKNPAILRILKGLERVI
ncbi:MAG: ATP phosphoribosyltransferase, partial [Oscillospiraceae bacterium]|nr:ATP phosphoribosyltransferase [Oscillospiraceae bacterium]